MEFFELLSWMNMFMPYGFEPFTALWVSAVIAGALFAVLFALQAIALWTIYIRQGRLQAQVDVLRALFEHVLHRRGVG